MSWFRRFRPKTSSIICLVCTLLVVGVYSAPNFSLLSPLHGPLQKAEFYTQDVLAQYFGRRAPLKPELVYLAIDRGSVQLDQFDPAYVAASPALSLMKQDFPWKRTVYPFIIERLIDAGAKVVAIDLMFPTARDGDDVFRAALDKYRDHIVVGSNFEQELTGGLDAGTTSLQMPIDDLITPTSPLDDRVGYVNFWPERDQVIRRVRYEVTMSSIVDLPPEAGEEVYYSLSGEALRKAGFSNLVPNKGPNRIRFAGRPGTFVPRSVCDLFDLKKWNSPYEYDGGKFFKDKIVLLGPEGNFLKDTVRSPFGQMAGPEMHLNAMNAALSKEFIADTSKTMNCLLVALAGMIAWLIGIKFSAPLLRLVLLVSAAVGWFVAAQLLYNHADLLIFTFTPLVALGSSGVSALSWDFFMERREKARIRGKFERYVSKRIVREIIDNPTSYLNILGGERKPIAMLFSDLRGFTTMMERAEDTHAVVKQLNEYFDVMVEPVIASNGVLDKFIGDAIMAAWGNLQSRGPSEDVRDAVSAALKMRAYLPALNEKWVAEGKEPLKLGIGINYGEAVVGELGSERHQTMNITAIGDMVNLASRIEGVTKEYAVDLLVGEDAANLVMDFFYMQVAGLVQVKGRKKPVKLYYVIGERIGEPDRKLVEYVRLYEEGMAQYMKGAFAEAGSQFRQALLMHPPDKLARVYIERCAMLEKEPVPQGWDGVFVMTKK